MPPSLHRSCALLAALLIGSGAVRAHAQTPEPEPEHLHPSDVRYTDAASNRVLFLPSAETQPEGTVLIGSYELIGLSVGYGVTDSIEVSLTGTAPIDGLPFAFELGAKANLLRGERLRLAVLGSFGTYVSDEREVAIGGRIGAAAQICLTDDCTSYATFAAGVLVSDRVTQALPMAFGFGLVARVHELVAIVVEPLYARVEQASPTDLLILNYALRIGTGPWALDLGVTRPFVEEIEGTPLLFGLPWLAFNYRIGVGP